MDCTSHFSQVSVDGIKNMNQVDLFWRWVISVTPPGNNPSLREIRVEAQGRIVEVGPETDGLMVSCLLAKSHYPGLLSLFSYIFHVHLPRGSNTHT